MGMAAGGRTDMLATLDRASTCLGTWLCVGCTHTHTHTQPKIGNEDDETHTGLGTEGEEEKKTQCLPGWSRAQDEQDPVDILLPCPLASLYQTIYNNIPPHCYTATRGCTHGVDPRTWYSRGAWLVCVAQRRGWRVRCWTYTERISGRPARWTRIWALFARPMPPQRTASDIRDPPGPPRPPP